jgi:predicted ribosome quality control (RQC) complex YloA/Tae2 family protein
MNVTSKALMLLLASLPTARMTSRGTVFSVSKLVSKTGIQHRHSTSSATSSSGLSLKRSVAFANHSGKPSSKHLTHSEQFRASATVSNTCNSLSFLRKQFRDRQQCFSTQQFMSSDDDTSAEHLFNMPNIKKETARLTLRTHKKIGKVSTRIRAAEDQLQKIRLAIDENTSMDMDDELMKQLESAPSTFDMEAYQEELEELQCMLQKLNWLEEQLNTPPLSKKKSLLTADEITTLLPKDNVGQQIMDYIEELDANKNKEQEKQQRIEQDIRNKRAKKEKSLNMKENNQQNEGGRLPYRRYYTESNVEIRVGKQATDNDVLSLSPEHRSSSHWWYHASGCPGSHVVLCTDVQSPSEEDILDAASLAALKSKCIGQSVIKVSMTRCRNVSKPPGAKPGLVQLNGEVKTVSLRKADVEKRCERLEKTVVVN